jgi:hypothetical protein
VIRREHEDAHLLIHQPLRIAARLKTSCLVALAATPPTQWPREIADLLGNLLACGPHHPIALFTLLSEMADSMPLLIGGRAFALADAFPTFDNVANAMLPASQQLDLFHVEFDTWLIRTGTPAIRRVSIACPSPPCSHRRPCLTAWPPTKRSPR